MEVNRSWDNNKSAAKEQKMPYIEQLCAPALIFCVYCPNLGPNIFPLLKTSKSFFHTLNPTKLFENILITKVKYYSLIRFEFLILDYFYYSNFSTHRNLNELFVLSRSNMRYLNYIYEKWNQKPSLFYVWSCIYIGKSITWWLTENINKIK